MKSSLAVTQERSEPDSPVAPAPADAGTRPNDGRMRLSHFTGDSRAGPGPPTRAAHLQATPSLAAADRPYLRQLFAALQHSVQEARYGVVGQDMRLIVEILNRLDRMMEAARSRLDRSGPALPGADGCAGPGAARGGEAGRLPARMRLEPDQTASVIPGPVAFAPGQIWRRPNGRIVFMVAEADRDDVEIHWWLSERFKTRGRFPKRDLSLYVRENQIYPSTVSEVGSGTDQPLGPDGERHGQVAGSD